MNTHTFVENKVGQNSFTENKIKTKAFAESEINMPTMPNYQIKYLKNYDLHERLQILAKKERVLTHEILLHIMEVDRRKLYLEMAYPSLWEYLVKNIGYSAPAAQRRIDAARLMVQAPNLGKKLESGSLNLSQVSLVQKTLREVQKKSPDGQRTRISPEQKQIILEKIENKSAKETEVFLAQEFNKPLLQKEVTRMQKDNSTRIEMTFSQSEKQILEQARDLLSHSLARAGQGYSLKESWLFCAKKVIQQKTGRKIV